MLDSTSHHAPTLSPYVLLFAAIADAATHSSSVVLLRERVCVYNCVYFSTLLYHLHMRVFLWIFQHLSSAPHPLFALAPHIHVLQNNTTITRTHVRTQLLVTAVTHPHESTKQGTPLPLSCPFLLLFLLSLLFRRVLTTKKPTSSLFE